MLKVYPIFRGTKTITFLSKNNCFERGEEERRRKKKKKEGFKRERVKSRKEYSPTLHVSKDSLNAFPIVLLPNDRCLESLYVLRKKKVRQGPNKINKR